MNNNSFEQIKNLLTQVSNYISKINEIIFQINNIINSQNQMNQMMQMNIMNNNMMRFDNNFIPIINPLLINHIPQKLNDKKINLSFNYRGDKINIVAEEYLPINEVINRFLKRIDMPELINNYQKKMTFLTGGEELDYSKTVEEINIYRMGILDIIVLIKKDVCDNA